MKHSKPILFCALILGILSTTQTNAFARGHEGHKDFGPGGVPTQQDHQQLKSEACFDSPKGCT